MSKQSENKAKQGFQSKCPCCNNCIHFTFKEEQEFNKYSQALITNESNLRCSLGNFSVKKSNWCKEHLTIDTEF